MSEIIWDYKYWTDPYGAIISQAAEDTPVGSTMTTPHQYKICEHCGDEIHGFMGTITTRKYGKTVLCGECWTLHRDNRCFPEGALSPLEDTTFTCIGVGHRFIDGKFLSVTQYL